MGCLGNPLGGLNFTHGHANGIAGATQYGDTGDGSNLRPTSISPNTNWVVACGRNTVAANNASVIVNGVVRTNARVPGGSSCALGINQDTSFQSDWQLSKLYVWDYHLSDEHFALASLSLNRELTGPVATAICLACPSNSSSPAGSTTNTACLCNAGYTGENGGTCSECGVNMTKAGLGPALCTPVEIEAAVAALIESMHTPISSQLDGEERTVFVDEFDRFFRINGLADMPVEYMHDIAERLLALALLREAQTPTKDAG